MFFDIKDILIVAEYIPQLKILKETYIDDYKRFQIKVDKKKERIDNTIAQESCQSYSSYEDLKYNYLATILIGIVSLWKNQLNDFYMLDDITGYNQLKKKLKENKYYDLDGDQCLFEIREVYNFLKHGPNGKAENNLINIKSKYYNDDNIKGEVRGNYLRNKQLNISENDIIYFSDKLIGFWQDVLNNIEKGEQR